MVSCLIYSVGEWVRLIAATWTLCLFPCVSNHWPNFTVSGFTRCLGSYLGRIAVQIFSSNSSLFTHCLVDSLVQGVSSWVDGDADTVGYYPYFDLRRFATDLDVSRPHSLSSQLWVYFRSKIDFLLIWLSANSFARNGISTAWENTIPVLWTAGILIPAPLVPTLSYYPSTPMLLVNGWFWTFDVTRWPFGTGSPFGLWPENTS